MIWAYYYLRHTWDKMPTLLQIVLTFHSLRRMVDLPSPTLGQAVDMFHAMVSEFPVRHGTFGNRAQYTGDNECPPGHSGLRTSEDDTLVVLRWREPHRSGIVILLFCLILTVSGEFGKRPFIFIFSFSQ